MTGRSTNQVDMSILPGVEEYYLRLGLIRKDVKDSAIANNHRIDQSMHPFNLYGRTDDVWMRCPLRETDSVQLDKVRRCVVRWATTRQSQRSSAPEPTNNPRTHRITNARSCSTENKKSLVLLRQLSFVIFVQGSFSISGWKVRRSTYAYPGVLNSGIIMRKSS